MDANLITVLNKGPSFVNANPKIVPKLSLTSRASLQLATDKLEQPNISGSVIDEFKGAIAKHIDTFEQLGKKVLKSKQIRSKIPPDNITITHFHNKDMPPLLRL